MSHELEEERARALAARVAGRLARGTAATTTAAAGRPSSADENAGGLDRELAALRVGLSEIKQRLAHLESHIVGEAECEHENNAHGRSIPLAAAMPHRRSASNVEMAEAPPRRWTSSTYIPVVPPSEQRFDINDAVSELADHFEQGKTCTLEPGGKPCDHCSMCSTRGF